MVKFNCVILAMALTSICNGQQEAIRLVVRGDDMGYSHSGNVAIMKCYKEGIEKSVEVIVPSPWFPEAVKLLQQNPGLDVGIHLALSSEWENIKWRPLSDCPSLKDSNGYFYPMIYHNDDYKGQALTENPWKIEDVEKEFRAQIEMALKRIPWISHISSHMDCTGISPAVNALVKKLAKEYKIDIDPKDYNATWVEFDGPSKTSEEKIESFTRMLNKLEPGKNYMFLEHPGINDDELKAVYHIGYEGVAIDRQGVTDMFTSEKVKSAIASKGIKIISYKELPHK
jgi:predicted glycoside hydrolase/deacetylase ChbG (UPF0249 family)